METETELSAAEYESLIAQYEDTLKNLQEGQIIRGRVIQVTPSEVIVDIGYKSEGVISIAEFTDYEGHVTVAVNDRIDVLLESTEDQNGYVVLSKDKAEKMRVWDDVEKAFREGTNVRGRIIDRIKGGLAVDIGVKAFLPGSLVDTKPVKNLDFLRGKEFEFKVISVDKKRGNIVLSRKAVIEVEQEAKKRETLAQLEEGRVLRGTVKNLTDYGAFVDLGGLDGLLHVTDISWGRINHPSDVLKVGDEIDVVVLKFDKETKTGNEGEVHATLLTANKGKKVTVDLLYRTIYKGGHWVVYDVVTDDQSLLENYRAEFNKIIEKDGFDALLKRMRRKLNEQKTD